MAGTIDPTYPFFPIVSFLASFSMLILLLTRIVSQKWNLGVTFLCFWLVLQNLANGINAILWSDNAGVRLYVYCDLGERATSLSCRFD